jgi:hypothetical protein
MGRVSVVKVILFISALLCSLSLLGPVFQFADYSLFLIYLAYFSVYVLSSVYIVWIFRQGDMFKEKKDSFLESSQLFGVLARRFHLLHLFRKNPRYTVHLHIECREKEKGLRFEGVALNISTGGLMASIDGLDRLYEHMIIKIIFPLDSGAHSMELPVEHLWMHDNEGKFYHGFRFLAFDGKQQQLIFKFLVDYKKE